MDLFSHLTHFEICSFGSGSAGNSYYIGNHNTSLLIDAGLSSRKIVRGLEEIGKHIRQIQAILVTHDHIDHIKGLPDISQRFNTPIFATTKTWEAILQNRFTKHVRPSCFNEVVAGQAFGIGTMKVHPFQVSHDSADAIGFLLKTETRNLGLATDLGHIHSEAAMMLAQAHVLILESNYDETMLNNGPYPAYLKERIKSNKGHLSNDQAAAYLAQTPHPQLQQVFLAHLSDHNNKPETALKTLNNALVAANGIGNNFQATAFDRKKRSKLFVIND